MKKITIILVLFQLTISSAQVGFSEGTTLLDLTHYTVNISMCSSDLNNDGKKELIIASRNTNTIIMYKNIDGDLQHNQRVILVDNSNATSSRFQDMVVTDLDADGLNDIIIADAFASKIIWFRNLGNFVFSEAIIIASNVDNPMSICAQDIDNDGDIDIVAGLGWGENVSLWLQDSLGGFGTAQVIQETNYGVKKVKLFDLDNNGLLDIISAQEDGALYWKKNIGGGVFEPEIYISGNAKSGFDFLKINGDNYHDIAFTDPYNGKVSYHLNLNGNSFSTSPGIIDNSISDPRYLLAKDMNNDGLIDIVVSRFTNDAIGWYQNNNGSFSTLNIITTNVSNPSVFFVEDFDSDGNLEVITSSDQKISMFEHDMVANNYNERVLNFYFGAVNTVKIADLNNDGHNDVISGYKGIVWNENHGNGDFSSQKLITAPTSTVGFNLDLDIVDLNGDGFKDIVTITNLGLEVYRNNGDETFDKVHAVSFASVSKEIELADIDGDGDYDILITFEGSGVNLGKIMNLGNFTFGALQPITFTNYGFKPNKIKCADMDNDGDIDIVVSSEEFLRIHLLENDGTGQFTCHLIRDGIYTHAIEVADIDNDNYLDIISAGYSSYVPRPIYSIRNLGNNTFGATNIIDLQSTNSIKIADLNNDGFDDIVGATYQYNGYDEQCFFYLNNGGTFGVKNIIEVVDQSVSLDRSIAVGDLNNDSKIDIVSGYYFINTVKYFLNTSELSVTGFDVPNAISLYPNPTTDDINWVGKHFTNVILYDLNGKIVLNRKGGETQTINISSLPQGTYIFEGLSATGFHTAKIVKN